MGKRCILTEGWKLRVTHYEIDLEAELKLNDSHEVRGLAGN